MKLKVTIEKQKSWKKETLDEKISWGVEGFTITDLPYSTILQAYWFLAGAIVSPFLSWSSIWSDTDTFHFYKNILGKKSAKEFFTIFLKLHSKLLDHEDTFKALSYTPNAILSVAANGRTKKTLLNKIDKILNLTEKNKIKGIFIVSGGGIIQRYFNKYFNFFSTSTDLLPYAREKIDEINKKHNLDLKIFAAVNTNIESENIERLVEKNQTRNVEEILTQPPFIWSRFEKYMKDLYATESLKNIEVRVGIPIFTSSWNVRFWFTLVGVNWRHVKEAEEIVRAFENAWNKDDSAGKEKFKKFSKNWTVNLIYRIEKEFPEVSGIHMMPMGGFISVEEVLIDAGILKNPLLEIPGVIYENIKYKNHFRDKVTFRKFENSSETEIIIDLNQFDYKNYANLKKEAQKIIDEEVEEKIELEKDFQTQSKSILWDFNYEFWQHLENYMSALNKDYKKSIGGSADSNQNLTNYCAKKLSESINDMQENYYLEIGAAGTDWAKKILEHLSKQNKTKNLTYIFTDFSEKVLENAKQELGENYLDAEIKYYLVNNKENYTEFLETYKNKITRIHATNLYDNFKANRFLFKNGKMYQILTKIVVPKLRFSNHIEILNELKNSGNVSKFLEKISYQEWEDLWNAMKFQEVCLEVEILPNKVSYANFEKLEFSSSQSVVRDILNNFELLKSGGSIEIIDIIATKSENFKNYLGPVKYDASVANYLNFPEIEQELKNKFTNAICEMKSLKEFGGKNNQSILEIKKN